jgi:hypothetical protein
MADFGIKANERFLEAHLYMTATALPEYQRTMPGLLAKFEQRIPAETPESLPTPEPLPDTTLQIGGRTIEIIPDLQGDYEKPTNSIVWIPSLQTPSQADAKTPTRSS